MHLRRWFDKFSNPNRKRVSKRSRALAPRGRDGASWMEPLETRTLLAFTFFDVRPAGTVNLSGISGFVEFDSKLFFRANDGSTGNEIWTSDGTTTSLFTDINFRPRQRQSLQLHRIQQQALLFGERRFG